MEVHLMPAPLFERDVLACANEGGAYSAPAGGRHHAQVAQIRPKRISRWDDGGHE
eukprot:CAMPEP_0185558442 /NCGR_PEP_ID=MMETSP1381-20130426/52277_1 /TAXON_ID=298111 /ORGANISM="Pavlova sp., Strain CCMP459" /LENGTH=54 /DNA_ID=CAMNT_0028171989 /DNA_START=122 /DNA_END=283 /DNA_ORIENTATION=+